MRKKSWLGKELIKIPWLKSIWNTQTLDLIINNYGKLWFKQKIKIKKKKKNSIVQIMWDQDKKLRERERV